MSAPVLTVEQVAAWGVEAASDRLGAFDWNGRFVALADSHEALRAERDALKARVAVLAAECRAWRLAHEAASPAAFAGDMERIGHAEDAYELMHRSIDVMMEVTRAATDANGGLDA